MPRRRQIAATRTALSCVFLDSSSRRIAESGTPSSLAKSAMYTAGLSLVAYGAPPLIIINGDSPSL